MNARGVDLIFEIANPFRVICNDRREVAMQARVCVMLVAGVCLSFVRPYAGRHRLTEHILALPGMSDR